MGRFAVLLLLTSGCSQLFGLDTPVKIDASTDDADRGTDASTDASGCYGHTNICLTSTPTDRSFGSETIDTSMAVRCDELVPQSSSEPDLCMLIGRNVLVTGVLKVVGSRPLVIVASETLSITASGVIDLASRTTGSTSVGAGANPASCVDGEDGTSTNNADAGGGAGASFRGKGGDGGDGDAAGGRAAAPASSAPTFVRGGCKGRRGGIANGAIAYEGGDGGGAVFLVAGIRLEVTGDINASGGGGKGGAIGGNGRCGGSGGGSGGLIWLDAPTVKVTGDVFANGGGGGGATGGALPGGTGGTSADPLVGGAGGTSGTAAGGDGSGGISLDGATGESTAGGGGGGGGGGGFIQVYSPSPDLNNQTISPPPIVM